MPKRLILLVWGSFTVGVLDAQSFTRTFGDMYAQDGVGVRTSANGFVVIAREFQPGQSQYAAVFHTTASNGSMIGSVNIDTPLNTFVQDVVSADDGSAIVVGSVLTPGHVDHDGLVVKLAASGGTVWRTMPDLPGSQQYMAGVLLPDGGIAVCGLENSGTGHRALVVRFGADGAVLWSHSAESPTEAEAYGIAVEGNDLLITGRQVNFSGNADVLLMRMDLSGTLLWSQARGASGAEEGRAITAIGGGLFITAGWTDSYGMFDRTSQLIPQHAYLIAFDLDGDTLWTKALGDTLFNRRAFDVVRGSNGDLILAGERCSTGSCDAALMRLTDTGSVLWERAIDTGSDERLTHLLPLPDGAVSTGWSFGPFGHQILFVRRNNDGF